MEMAISHELAERITMHGRLVHQIDEILAGDVSLLRGETQEFIHDGVGSGEVLQFIGLQVHLCQMKEVVMAGQFVGTRLLGFAFVTSLAFVLRSGERIRGNGVLVFTFVTSLA